MPHLPNQSYLIPFEPRDLPGLVSFWNFETSGTEFTAQQGEPYCLHAQSGALEVVEDASAYGGRALYLQEGQWLSIPWPA